MRFTFNNFSFDLYKIFLLLFITGMFTQVLWNETTWWTIFVVAFIIISMIQYGSTIFEFNGYIIWIVALSALIALISVFSAYSSASFASLTNFVKVGVFVTIIIINCRSQKDLDYLMLCIWIAGLFIVYNLLLNFDPSAIALVDETYATSTRLGLGGVEHPNTTAYNIVISYACGMYLINKGISSRTRKIVLIVGEVLLAVGCLLTGSRKVLITLILLPVMLIVYRNKNPLKLMGQIIVGVILVYFVYNLTQNNAVLYNLIGHRIEDISSIFGGGDASADGRRDLIFEGIKLGFSKFFGVGLNCFIYYSSDAAYAHNEFVEILADTGVMGFLIYYIPIFSALFSTFKEAIYTVENESYKLEQVYWVSLLINILILSMFEVSFGIFSYHLVIAMFLAKLTQLNENAEDEGNLTYENQPIL